MRYTETLYDPLYATLGVAAVLILTDSEQTNVPITVIDKTSGMSTAVVFPVLKRMKPEVDTVKPGACVRAKELRDNGITNAMLEGCSLQMNGFNWTVDTFLPRPSPHGELHGELLLVLSQKVELDSETESE